MAAPLGDVLSVVHQSYTTQALYYLKLDHSALQLISTSFPASSVAPFALLRLDHTSFVSFQSALDHCKQYANSSDSIQRLFTFAWASTFPILAGIILFYGRMTRQNVRSRHEGNIAPFVALIRSPQNPSALLEVHFRRDSRSSVIEIVHIRRVNQDELEQATAQDVIPTTSALRAIDGQSSLSISSSDELSTSNTSFDSLADLTAHISLECLDDLHSPCTAARMSGASSRRSSGGVAAASVLRSVMALSQVASVALVHSAVLIERVVQLASRRPAVLDGCDDVLFATRAADTGVHDKELYELARNGSDMFPEDVAKTTTCGIASSGGEAQQHGRSSATVNGGTSRQAPGYCTIMRNNDPAMRVQGCSTLGAAQCMTARPGIGMQQGASFVNAERTAEVSGRDGRRHSDCFSDAQQRHTTGASSPTVHLPDIDGTDTESPAEVGLHTGFAGRRAQSADSSLISGRSTFLDYVRDTLYAFEMNETPYLGKDARWKAEFFDEGNLVLI
ncbi:unnamed protein product [Peniophora sp. CBMAI 1063]|nr:unnamed protein product [Peniophora sp. CBMAI 1063]